MILGSLLLRKIQIFPVLVCPRITLTMGKLTKPNWGLPPLPPPLESPAPPTIGRFLVKIRFYKKIDEDKALARLPMLFLETDLVFLFIVKTQPHLTQCVLLFLIWLLSEWDFPLKKGEIRVAIFLEIFRFTEKQFTQKIWLDIMIFYICFAVSKRRAKKMQTIFKPMVSLLAIDLS